MKIEKVAVPYRGILGDAEIHMNVDGKFTLKIKDELPVDYKYDVLPEANTLESMRKLVQVFCENCIRKTPLGRKIYLSVKSSTKVTPYNIDELNTKKNADKWSMVNTDTFKFSDYGDGFSLAYLIVDTYNYKYKTQVGTKDPYVKDMVLQRDPIYGWRDKVLYEIVKTNHRSLSPKIGQVLEYRDAFFTFDTTHVMDYNPETEDFLVSIVESIETMVQKIVTFFNVEPAKLIENMAGSNNTKLLGS